MTPTNQLGAMQPSPNQGGSQPQVPQPQDQQAQPSPLFGNDQQGQSAAQQLIQDVAPLHAALKEFAASHAEMSEAIDQAISVINDGMTKAISEMSTRDNEGQQPAYA